MIFQDTLTLDAPRKTADGFLVASVRAARTGIQQYSGREIDPENKHGLRDKAVVNVYRDEAEVFSADSLRSFSVLDVTIDHPPEAVTADNWKKYAVGVTGEEVVRDGQFIRIPMMLKDRAAIDEVEGGKNQLSVGYSTELKFEKGVTADGLQFDAKQTKIRANHISVVGMARGGPELKIGDSKTMKTILIDGHSVEVSDAAGIAIAGLQRQLTDAQKKISDQVALDAKAATEKSGLEAKIATLDAEIATLKAAQLTGDKLDAAVAERAKLISDAKKIGGDTLVITGTNDEIKKRAVLAKLGDSYSARDKAFFDAAFELQVAGIGAADSVRTVLNNAPLNIGDAAAQEEKAFNDSNNDLNAWRNAKTA